MVRANSSRICLSVGILTLLCDATHPQEVRTEHLVPLASQESLTQITPSLRAELDLFADIENFRRARLFRGTDGSYVLEIEYGTELRTSHQRQALTAAGVDSLRHSIDIHRRRLQDRPRLDHPTSITAVGASSSSTRSSCR